MEIKVDEVISWITEILRAEVTKEDETFIFTVERRGEKTIEVLVSDKELSEKVEAVNSKKEIDETVLFDTNNYEVLVKNHSFRSPFFRREGINQEDSVNNIKYHLSDASEEYLIFFLYKVAQLLPVGRSLRTVRIPFQRPIERPKEELSIFEVLRFYLPRVETLLVKSNRR